MSNACLGTFKSFSPLISQVARPSAALSRSVPCLVRGIEQRCLLNRVSPILRAQKHTAPYHERGGDTSSRPRWSKFSFQPQSRQLQTSSPLLNPVPSRRTPSSKSTSRPSSRSSNSDFTNLSSSTLKTIFGEYVSPGNALATLKTLHTRRVDGSLIDHGVHIQDCPVSDEACIRALKWLRQKYPVDEQTAATAYSGREAEKLSDSYIARAERLGIYKPIDGEQTGYVSRNEYSGINTERSVLEENRLYHEERRKREEEEREKSGENRRVEELRVAKLEERQKNVELRHQQRVEFNEKMEQRGYASDLKEIPEMSKLRRLGPSTAFGIVSLAALIYFAYTYKPPLRANRIWPELPISIATTLSIGFACLFITILWHIPRAWPFVNRYFIMSTAYPYAFGLLGNIFSHQTFRHLGGNILGGLAFAIPVHEEIGRGNFIALYVSSGMLGALFSMYYYTFTNILGYYHFGASGCVWGLLTAWIYLDLKKTHDSNEPERFLRYARYAVAAQFLWGNFGRGVMMKTDVCAHFGGGVVGGVWAWWLSRRAEMRKKERERSSDEGGVKVEPAREGDNHIGIEKTWWRKKE